MKDFYTIITLYPQDNSALEELKNQLEQRCGYHEVVQVEHFNGNKYPILLKDNCLWKPGILSQYAQKEVQELSIELDIPTGVLAEDFRIDEGNIPEKFIAKL